MVVGINLFNFIRVVPVCCSKLNFPASLSLAFSSSLSLFRMMKPTANPLLPC